jgi:hypothetical protein
MVSRSTRRANRCLIVGLAAAFALAAAGSGQACTTAVVAGSATANGRPLLWKNRDAENKQNQVVYDDTGRYPFVGVVNSGDPAGFEVWAGVNARGFAIMNSASYNLAKTDSTAEGQLMRLALQSCATIEEFQALLEKTNGGRDVTANFGVIDARGGAAIFEASRTAFKRFDAADPTVAPACFIVRTNYSDSGDADAGSGMLRRARAASLLYALVAGKSLTAATLLAGPARDVANVEIGSYPAQGLPAGTRFAYTADSVCRYDTASAVIFEGVRPGEDPLLSTMWVIPGEPITGAAVPVWVRAAAVPSALAAAAGASPTTKALDAVRTLFYPETRGELKKFVSVAAFAAGPGAVLPRLLAGEAENFRLANAARARWLSTSPSAEEVQRLENELAARTLADIEAIAPKSGGE